MERKSNKTKQHDRYKAKVQPIPNAPRTSPKIEPLPNLPRDFQVEEDIEPMKKAQYNSKLMSPKGDFVIYQERELKRAFPRPIKATGSVPIPSKALPYTTEKMEKDRGM